MVSLRRCRSKYSSLCCSPETLLEVVRYNLMIEWRRESGRSTLCFNDLTFREKELFHKEVKKILIGRKLRRMSVNPFEDREETILLQLGIIE